MSTEGSLARKTADFKTIYKAVAVYPLENKLTKNVWLSIPQSVPVPIGREFILEGLHYEQPKTQMIGKRIQLLFDLSQSSLISHSYLESYELSPHQMSIEECLAIEEENKKRTDLK